MLTRGGSDAAATMTSDMDAVETAGVAPAADAAAPRVVIARPGEEPVVVEASAKDPVEEYLSSGKELPSYISDAPAEAASSEAAPVNRLVAPGDEGPAEPIDVAAVSPESAAVKPLVAPLPYPASMRPITPAPPAPTVATVAPVPPPATSVPSTAPEAPVTTTAAAPPMATTAPEEPVVIVDEDLVARREAAVAAVLGDEPVELDEPSMIDDEELEEWDSGSLADYLERRGLISDRNDDPGADFDEDGFFLDEGPNSQTTRRRLRREFFF
jgi:hypothetical protein